jgi:hypothetical protein
MIIAIFYSKEKALNYLHSFPIYKCSRGYDRNISYRTYTYDISSDFLTEIDEILEDKELDEYIKKN